MIDRVAPLAFLALAAAAQAGRADEPSKAAPGSALAFPVTDIDGKPVDLAQAHRGKVLLIVNTASQCGLTPQYAALESTYNKYKAKGFEVLAFPANEFGAQEPGSDGEIKAFCSTNYHVTFPLYAKIVVKGPGIHPLYKYLTSPETDPKFAGEIPWNFTKFLVDRDGRVVARFEPGEKPDSPKVAKAIEAALAGSK